MNFWIDLKKPIIGLSPMDGITDPAFRYIVNKYGDPDVTYTEFESVDALLHSKDKYISKLLYHEIERPIVAQFFGIDPELFFYAAIIATELGFDGVDINMGCPSKNVSQRGAGGSLIKTPELAERIIERTREGLSADSSFLPQVLKDKVELTKQRLIKLGTNVKRSSPSLSVKTRIGYSSNELESWIPHLALSHPSCICIHGRTLKQMYSGLSDWEAIKQARDIIKGIDKQIIVLGNGDCENREHGEELASRYGLDGVLIGRASLGDPYIFKNKKAGIIEIFKIIDEHSKLYEQISEGNLIPLRKHLAWYIKGIEGASELRSKLVRVSEYNEVKKILSEYLDKIDDSK